MEPTSPQVIESVDRSRDITYSVSFCDGYMVETDDNTHLISSTEENNSLYNDDTVLSETQTIIQNSARPRPIPGANNGNVDQQCCVSSSYPISVSHHGFENSNGYGSLPDRMGVIGQDNPALETGTQRVVYCIHGNTSGCCATLVNDSTKSSKLNNGPAETITIVDEHCHSNVHNAQVDKKARRKLIIASILCLIFMIAEIIGGYLSSSLAIATDAAHLLTDFASFMISLFAIWVARRKPTRSMPFGWYRAEVIGALTSVLTIWVVTGILVYMAIERIIEKDFEINATIMLITSAIGVLVNLVMGLTLHQHGHSHGGASHDHNHEHDHEENINVRAAFIHVVGDFLQSFGVFVAAIVIYFYPEWNIIDPICTFLFSILVLLTTMSIMKDTLNVLMEGMPKGVDFNNVMNTFMSIDGVVKVHNLRIWALSLDKTALAAHLAISQGVDSHEVLKSASRKIHSKFNFFEMTLQIEVFEDRMQNCKQCQCPED